MKYSNILICFIVIFSFSLRCDELVVKVKREYYDSGKVKREILFNKETKKTKLQLYYETGEILAIYAIKNGEFNGIQKTFFKKGKLSSKSFMKNSKLHGEFKSFYISGKLRSISNYDKGILIGTSKDFYESGKISTVWEHTKGISQGKSYYETGELKFKVKFSDLQILFLRGFLKTGKPLNGKIVINYESGMTNTKGNFIDGFPDGKLFSYYESSNISNIGNFNRGKPSGEHLSYNESGKMILKVPYLNGVIHGIVEIYSEELIGIVKKILYNNGKKINENSEKIRLKKGS